LHDATISFMLLFVSRKRFTGMNCSVARALDVLGDWWTLLIVRDAFLGVRRFGDFARDLGIAKNILNNRLQRLVEEGVFSREEVGDSGQWVEYRLTPKGRDLAVVLNALRDWGDRWVYGEGNEPVILRDRKTGKRLPPLRIHNDEGEPVAGRDIVMEAGPGADGATSRRFERSGPG
jgi:DNA-binding HxlR family transcriptional regulator